MITGSVSTTALGTAFNINAFSANGSIEISLVHGKVLVESKKPSGKPSLMELNPGEMATVLKSNYEVSKSSFDFNEKISWKDGIIFFRDARYHKVMTTLENWYGVTIIENNFPTKEWKFSGKFEDENLENILIALQFGHEFEYAINGNKVNLNF